MIFSPFFAKLGGEIEVSNSVKFGVVLLCIALIMFIVYFFMDKKLDAQTGEAEEKDDPFKISDIGKILSSLGFWLVALLCVLYYTGWLPCSVCFITAPSSRSRNMPSTCCSAT